MEGAFGVPPTADPGNTKEGVFAFGNDIIGQSVVGGTDDGDAGTGVAGAAPDDEAVLDANFRLASWSST